MAILASRYRPPRPAPLNWSGDPLWRAAQAGRNWRETLTPGQARAGLDYNKALYTPGSAEMRAVVTPTPRATLPPIQSTNWRSEQQPMGRVGLASIASRYRGTPDGMPASYAYPGGGTSPFKTVSANPAVQPQNPHLESSPTMAASGAGGPAGSPGDTAPAPPVTSPVTPVPPPVLEGSTLPPPSPLDTGASAAHLPSETNQPPVATANPMGARPNMDQGGGLYAPGNQTEYKAFTGRIDARATPSRQNYVPAPVTFKKEGGHSQWTPHSEWTY